MASVGLSDTLYTAKRIVTQLKVDERDEDMHVAMREFTQLKGDGDMQTAKMGPKEKGDMQAANKCSY